MLWSIWKRRNNQEWEQIAEISQNVCDRPSNLLMSWRNHSKSEVLETWHIKFLLLRLGPSQSQEDTNAI
jgi:hypothetical protein